MPDHNDPFRSYILSLACRTWMCELCEQENCEHACHYHNNSNARAVTTVKTEGIL